MRYTDTRIKKTEIVIYLRYSTDSRSRITARRLLINGDRRRKTVDTVKIRLFQLTQELSGIRRKRFDISPLPLRINSIKSQRGLAGTGKARDHNKLVSRYVQVDVLKVMFSRTADADIVIHVLFLSN